MVDRLPNVLFVLVDEWRAQAFGFAGDSNASTPTIDGFASESVNFQEAISGSPICCPARASFVTGQYPLTHGVYINDVELKPSGPTVGEVFQSAGYRTGYIGKWHLHGSPDGHYERREECVPEDKRFGFEYWKAAECTHDYNKSFYFEGTNPVKQLWDGYDAIAQTDDACQFVRDNALSDSPYFLVLSLGPPHFPLGTAPKRYQDKYADRQIDLRPNVPAAKTASAIEDLRGYYAHISALDDCFERLLAVIEETGAVDDTIVIFTSDHGDMMGSQGLDAKHKIYPWEESIRVPLLIRYPARLGAGGSRSSALVNSPDIMPMLLGLCDIPIPASVQGTNFFSSESDSALPVTTAFLSMPAPTLNSIYHGIGEYRGVRDSRYTYVRALTGPWLLYDNISDPYQMHNLCGVPEFEALEKRLESELKLWLKLLDDDFLPANEYLERDKLTHYHEVNVPVGRARSPWRDWESTMEPTKSKETILD